MDPGLKMLNPTLVEDLKEVHPIHTLLDQGNHSYHQDIYVGNLVVGKGQGGGRVDPINSIGREAQRILADWDVLAIKPRIMPVLHRVRETHLGKATLATEPNA